MQYSLSILLGLLISFQVHAAQTQTSCELLESTLVTSFDDQFPLTISAGSSVQLEVTLKFQPGIKDWFEKSRMPFIPLQLTAMNDTQGSKSLAKLLSLSAEDIEEANGEKKLKIDLTSSKAMMGQYSPRLVVMYYGADDACFKVLAQPQGSYISIENTPDLSDIDPPKMSDLNFPRNIYAIGDELKVRARLEDKSAICTVERSENGECQMLSHVQFEELSSGRKVNAFPSLKHTDDGFYEITLKLDPKNEWDHVLFSTGRFKIKAFDISDVWGNSIHDVPAILQHEFEIR